MSHFTVLVVGEDVEEALAPFDENISVEPYDNGDGETTTYNPKSKWDWYQVGGRWRGSLKLKPGAAGVLAERSWTNKDEIDKPDHVDSAAAGDVDWMGMYNEGAAKARETFAKLAPLVREHGFQTWEACKAEAKGDIDVARQIYHGQPVMEPAKAALGDDFWGPGEALEKVKQFIDNEDGYVDSGGKDAVGTYALLVDGEWIEPGEMGWFGMSGATINDTVNYKDKFWEIVTQLPADTLVTVVDCHI